MELARLFIGTRKPENDNVLSETKTQKFTLWDGHAFMVENLVVICKNNLQFGIYTVENRVPKR